MQKHIQHNKDERTQFFRKIYLSFYLEGFKRVTKGIICERLQQHFFPVLLGCSTEGLEAQLWLGHGSHSSIFSPTGLNFLSPGLYNNLTSTYFLRASHLYSIQPVDCQGYPLNPWYLRPDAPVVYTGTFLIWQPGRVGGQYVTPSPVNVSLIFLLLRILVLRETSLWKFLVNW